VTATVVPLIVYGTPARDDGVGPRPVMVNETLFPPAKVRSIPAVIGPTVADPQYMPLGPATEGAAVGALVGAAVGALVGAEVGALVGPAVGAEVGPLLGPAVGAAVGPAVGPAVGASVGPTGEVGTTGPSVGVTGPSVGPWCLWITLPSLSQKMGLPSH